MEIRILGAHNLESADARMASILIDGVLAIDAGSLTSTLSLSEQERLRSILLTHYHFDHIRDIPIIGMNIFSLGTIHLYSLTAVFDALTSHIINDDIYPDFSKKPSPESPALRLCPIEPLKPQVIDGYTVLAVPVHHAVPTVGYQVTSVDGKSVFYTSDTGPGLSACWEAISPDLLITEATMPNRFEEFVIRTGHLSPRLLKQELIDFRRIKGYLPPVVLIHRSPQMEDEIKGEVEAELGDIDTTITFGYEGMRIQL